MQRFTTDVYLDTFLDELHQQGLTYEITDRHPLQIAPIADYRGGWIMEPEATDEEAKIEYTPIDR
jgi:hypothetical protein